ncbi:hypothetical protein CLV51_1011085 [Chitinophaga niastensis]|uniref:Uncharacterized protein n=1 Tax=Chitinophaga niastensis TaxID=536980 RepID=A0A2P8HU43_CHINA|nr:hypothetical protein [Chitinophaga niastensis]PSL49750.1 hypothetical protein CLV51_1011085 [Chitinophaga niastensis]
MATADYVLQMMAAFNAAKDYTQVDNIIAAAEKDNNILFKGCLIQLQEKIEALSPLDCNSSQWSIYRYALMCLRRSSMMHTV